ncbi:MAG: hypothetical protein WCE46_03975 [Methanoregula sp.]|uniref:hypothetical protein n=1 Tax=Methanoregula sp. TaxID=2052170 RepID=UPI003C715026
MSPQIFHMPDGGGSSVVVLGSQLREEEEGKVSIHDLIHMTASFYVVRAIRGTTVMSPARTQRDTVSVNFSPMMMLCWAAIRMTDTITWDELVEECTKDKLVDGLPIDLAADPDRAKKINRDIDIALASLCGLGLASASRIERDHLHEGVPDGDTSKELKRLAELRERQIGETRLERAKLEYRLSQLKGEEIPEKSAKAKKTAGA